jgi:asparagine synthetase B (glutamine-hydrolysing)
VSTLKLETKKLKYPYDLGSSDNIDEQLLILFDNQDIEIVDDWGKLRKDRLCVNKEGIWEFLQLGFVAPPYTIYSNVYKIPFGYRAYLQSPQSLVLVDEFPFDREKSSQKSDISEEALIKELCLAVKRCIGSERDTVLLHSGGKDSNLIAVAVNKLGLTNVKCISYEGGYRDSESLSSEAIASHLKLPQETIYADPCAEFNALNKLLRFSHNLSCDFSLPAFAFVAEKVGGNTLFVDGLGNDTYMGYLDTSVEKLIKIFNFSKFRKFELSRFTKSDYLNYAINSLFMCRSSRTFPGSRLSEPEASKLLREKYTSLTLKFKKVAKKEMRHGKQNFRARVRGRLCDDAMFMEKSRMMAKLNGGLVRFPFADRRFSSYLFNLPNTLKFDDKNKIIFRRILDKILPDTTYVHKKSGLRFNMKRFINRNKKEISETIRNCEIIDLSEADKFLNIHFKNLNYISAQKIYLVYCLAYWWTHNSFNFKKRNIEINYE